MSTVERCVSRQEEGPCQLDEPTAIHAFDAKMVSSVCESAILYRDVSLSYIITV